MSFTPGSKVHFVGIGGAGMSAIAKVLLERGCVVTGSDLKPSKATGLLEALGAKVTIGHRAALVRDVDIVVVSSAIPTLNPEVTEAKRLALTLLTRGRALAAVLSGTPSIIVAGTHGKTSTTSMIVSILLHAGIDPTYLVGGGLNDVGTNARSGRDPVAVAESDESDGSFLDLEPTIAVVTNLEADHLDHWGSFEALQRGFVAFLAATREEGTIVVPSDDAWIRDAASGSGRSVISFGASGDVSAWDVSLHGGTSSFELSIHEASYRVRLGVPGLHNVQNALAAAAACVAWGIDGVALAGGLARYRGVERRFQLRGRSDGVTVIDDYAHHPTEIRATLAAARTGIDGWRRVVAVFQPHRYSRTAALAREFGSCFADADRIVVTDVYGAGEEPVAGVTGKSIADQVSGQLPGRPVAYIPHRADLVAYLERTSRPGDALLTLGAGDISTLGDELLARLEDR